LSGAAPAAWPAPLLRQHAANAVPALQASRSARACAARPIRRRAAALRPALHPVELFHDLLKPGGRHGQRLAGSVVRGIQRRGWAPAPPHSAALNAGLVGAPQPGQPPKPPFPLSSTPLLPSLIAAARADCGTLAQVGSAQLVGGGRGGDRDLGGVGRALVVRVLQPARAEVTPLAPTPLPPSSVAATRADCGMLAQVGSAQPVAEGAAEVATLGRLAALSWLGCSGRPARRWPPTTASTTPPCHLGCCWHDPNQAWWWCVCAGRLVRRRWFCSKPPSPSLTLPLAVPLRPPAEPAALEPPASLYF